MLVVRGVVVTIGGTVLVGVAGRRSRSISDWGRVDEIGSLSSENWDDLEGVTEEGISTGARSNAAASWSLRMVISSLASTTSAQSRVMYRRRGSRTSKFVFETLALFLHCSLVEQLVLQENLLLKHSRVLLLDVSQAGGDGSFVTFEVIITHFQLPELYLDLLIILTNGI